MHKTHQSIKYVIQGLVSSLWDGVAQSFIEKRMALVAARLESFQLLASYMSSATANREHQELFTHDKQPKNIPIDNFAYGQLQKQTIKKNSDKQEKNSMTDSKYNRSIRSNRRITTQNFLGEARSTLSKTIPQQAKQAVALPQMPDPHEVIDPKQDTCRKYKFDNEKQEKDMKQMVENRIKQRQDNSLKNKKILKDMKKYTFDYEGQFVGVGGTEGTNKKLINLEKESGQQQVIAHEKKIPEEKKIEATNTKAKTQKQINRQKQKSNQPQFNPNQPKNIIDMFEEENKIVEGVKVIGLNGNEKIVKEAARKKLAGLKKYNFHQYQTITKDVKFKQFAFSPRTISSPNIDFNVNKALPHNVENIQVKSKQLGTINSRANPENRLKNLQTLTFRSNANSQNSLKIKKGQHDSILPPIQNIHIPKKRGLKRFSFAHPYSQRNYSQRSILNETGAESLKSGKSHIKVDSQQLYFQNFSFQTLNK